MSDLESSRPAKATDYHVTLVGTVKASSQSEAADLAADMLESDGIPETFSVDDVQKV